MKGNYIIEDKVIHIKKDCKACIHYPVCKFHDKMKETCKSNLMYEMTEYTEWNDTLSVFERHASCQYYKTSITELTHDMKYDIAKLNVPEGFSVHTTRFEGNSVIWNGRYEGKKDHETLTRDMTDIFNEYSLNK